MLLTLEKLDKRTREDVYKRQVLMNKIQHLMNARTVLIRPDIPVPISRVALVQSQAYPGERLTDSKFISECIGGERVKGGCKLILQGQAASVKTAASDERKDILFGEDGISVSHDEGRMKYDGMQFACVTSLLSKP